ncbi:esterase-like activity of phytase family protein [Croceibacterium xixiisoli]|nr:esterase-like activity of phytase family protein [Croceibacterium xixiisoli]
MLAPGTWWRSPLPAPDNRQILSVQAIPASADAFAAACAPVVLEKAWHLTSPNDHFGGYSGLVRLDGDRFLAGSDRGDMLIFDSPDPPGHISPAPPRLGPFNPDAGSIKRNSDLEALTRDPKTGQIWAGYEFTNSIVRYNAQLQLEKDIAPKAMRFWPQNSGPESVTRLNDGRFIVLAERHYDGSKGHTPALLFPGDPVEGARPIEFRFPTPDGMAPVDAATLPDGRVVILLRGFRFGLPPRFHTRLVVGDPKTIRAGKAWQLQDIAALRDETLFDNYEGITIEPAQDGTVFLWIISDDNTASFQRTLLLKARWNPTQTCPS